MLELPGLDWTDTVPSFRRYPCESIITGNDDAVLNFSSISFTNPLLSVHYLFHLAKHQCDAMLAFRALASAGPGVELSSSVWSGMISGMCHVLWCVYRVTVVHSRVDKSAAPPASHEMQMLETPEHVIADITGDRWSQASEIIAEWQKQQWESLLRLQLRLSYQPRPVRPTPRMLARHHEECFILSIQTTKPSLSHQLLGGWSCIGCIIFKIININYLICWHDG